MVVVSRRMRRRRPVAVAALGPLTAKLGSTIRESKPVLAVLILTCVIIVHIYIDTATP